MPRSDFSVLKTFEEKRIPENYLKNRIWNSCLDVITKEIWSLN